MPSVYLKSVTIRRFKQFEDVVFDLSTTREYSFNQEVLTEDGRFVKTALVYGQNGAGKSNLGLAVMDLTLHLTDAEKIWDSIVITFVLIPMFKMQNSYMSLCTEIRCIATNMLNKRRRSVLLSAFSLTTTWYSLLIVQQIRLRRRGVRNTNFLLS